MIIENNDADLKYMYRRTTPSHVNSSIIRVTVRYNLTPYGVIFTVNPV